MLQRVKANEGKLETENETSRKEKGLRWFAQLMEGRQ